MPLLLMTLELVSAIEPSCAVRPWTNILSYIVMYPCMAITVATSGVCATATLRMMTNEASLC
jgi:hypothetical protein